MSILNKGLTIQDHIILNIRSIGIILNIRQYGSYFTASELLRTKKHKGKSIFKYLEINPSIDQYIKLKCTTN